VGDQVSEQAGAVAGADSSPRSDLPPPGLSSSGLSTTTTDVLLFSRVQQGDRRAFQELFRRHQRAVYWAAFSVLRSRPDSEEALQDAFLTLWNKRLGVDLVGESVLPWLVTTARYLALNRRRSETRRPRDSLDDRADLADPAPSPESAAIADEARRHIQDIMAALPEVDRRIFDLCLMDDLSYEQAAQRLGITHATLRNRLSRLKGRLRAELTLLKGEPHHAAQ
jgi:RNA polymerase sigma factor (sigma-70 family)